VAVLFEETQKHFSSADNVKITFENPENIILETDENYLKTIIRNLTGNAIQALGKTPDAHIIWKAWKENNTNYLSVTDNGSGGTKEKFKALYDDSEVVGIKSGLGLHLIRDLANAINCKIEVDSRTGFGTTFTLKFCNELH
jgi:signal transduction histidine kinase